MVIVDEPSGGYCGAYISVNGIDNDDDVIGAGVAQHQADTLVEHVAVNASGIQQLDAVFPKFLFGLKAVQVAAGVGDVFTHLHIRKHTALTMHGVIHKVRNDHDPKKRTQHVTRTSL